MIVDFNEVANIEPAILSIYYFPVGTDYRIERGFTGSIHFVDNLTGKEVYLNNK